MDHAVELVAHRLGSDTGGGRFEVLRRSNVSGSAGMSGRRGEAWRRDHPEYADGEGWPGLFKNSHRGQHG